MTRFNNSIHYIVTGPRSQLERERGRSSVTERLRLAFRKRMRCDPL